VKTSTISYSVYGEIWKFHLASQRSYHRKFGSDSEAICLLKERAVWFNKAEFSPQVVAHELMHILFSQSNHNSAELDAHQVEELAAEIVARSFDLIPHITISIYSQLMASR
jgi:hypothetical protein